MRTCAIITIIDQNNYGNRLQNYAVHRVLSDMGFSVKTLAYHIKNIYCVHPMNKKEELVIEFHRLTKYKYYTEPKNLSIYYRNKAFRAFTRKYIPTKKIDSLDIAKDKIDFFVIGSDQVWNPLWYHNRDKELYLLSFAKPEQKVCISPSFGISVLPDVWKPWFREQLGTFPELNVREQAGAEIIKELTGEDAQVTIDPTLMLDAKDWLKFAKKPYGVNTRKPYILTYFLGNTPNIVEEDIKEILDTKKMSVLHLLDVFQPFVYACGPSEFLYLFSKADLILTDSFHACVFSFLFNKPFAVYDREQFNMPQMNSRLNTLLPMLKIERKYRKNKREIDWFECDYSEGWNNLRYERAKMLTYLKEALNRKER